MYRFLFEQPVTLFFCCAAGQIVFVLLWARRRTTRTAQAAWVALAATVILPALSVLVVTPAERIIDICHGIAHAIERGDVQTVSTHIALDFRAGELDRDALRRRLQSALSRARVDRSRLHSFEINLSSDALAVATFRARCRIRTSETTLNALPSRWRVTFRREGNAWRITHVESLPVPPLNLRRLSDWLR